MTVQQARVQPEGVEQAARLAADAARTAGVTVREIATLEEIDAVNRLYGQIWGRQSSPAIGPELLRALVKAGNYVVGAYDGPTLVGACVGFFSAPAEGALHSHIAGVSAQVRGRSVGFALKVHQRAWALHHGAGVIAWTFDPLVRRNAHFNVAKLAAQPVEYLPNFYGGMRDGINDGDDSDRLLLHWQLDRPEVAAACAGRPPVLADVQRERAGGASVGLAVSASGGPASGPLDADVVLVAVPPDIETMRQRAPGLAREWRAALRETLTTLLADGAVVTAFDRAGRYVVCRPDPDRDPSRTEHQA